MNENKFPLTLTIPTDIKDLDLIYWLRQPSVDTMKTRYNLTYPRPSLYMQRIIPYANRKAMDELAQRALSFEVNENNIADVQAMFRTADDWFTEAGKKEIFGMTDNGVLVFNIEYKNLNAMAVDKRGSARTALQIVPIAQQVAYEKYEPGAVLYINKKENAITLSESQFRRLSAFFQNFSFIAYSQFLTSMFRFAKENGNIITYQQYLQRVQANQQTNSNFRAY